MKIAVIGGGVSGLAIAYYLGKQGHTIFLFEKNKTVGGLSGYFQYKNTYIDKYYHFICGEDKTYINLLKELNLQDKIYSNITKMGYFYHDKIFSMSTPFDLLFFSPLSSLDRFKYIYSLLYLRIKKNWVNLDEVSSCNFLRKISGEKVWQIIWQPTLVGKFGNYAKDISAAWMLKRIKRVATSRVKFGFYEKMRYLEGGTKTFIDEIEKKILQQGGIIFKNSDVKKIIIENNIAKGILINDAVQNFDKTISCIPLPLFLKIADGLPDGTKTLLKKIKYTGVTCAVVILKRNFTEYFWLNLNSENIPFVNLVEYTNLDKQKEKKIIYIPEYLDVDSERFKMDYSGWKEEYFQYLKKINHNFKDEDVDDFFIFRDEFAQPICNVGFRKLVPSFISGVENLYFLDACQLYPSDRTISGSIGMAKELTNFF